MATATRHLIEMQLKGKTLSALVSTERRNGRSWQSIADEVHKRTGVCVSRETLRKWFPEIARTDFAA
ncbi:hypothetical protein [Rhodococcus aetherivorans]|uniref:hypothetical protein n=1 Tax=Rhodococcus aetherivorans TaxID=191292 RepID=UPI00045D1911|nr:hypothetical protein [Rhodococcus aetherivorans]KDE14218.1 hypothetical protein N505_0105170 [Rhodococcus aetherivorans]